MFPAHQGVEAWMPEVWSARRGQARSRLWRWLEEPGLRSSCRPDNIGPSALVNPARLLSDSGCYLVLPGPSFSSRSVNGFGRNIALGVRRRYVPNAVRQRQLQKERRGRRHSSRQAQQSAASATDLVISHAGHAAACSKRNSTLLRHILCSTVASLRATATSAFRPPIRSDKVRPHREIRDGRVERRSMTLAAS